jgi:hypothetical protein
MTFAGRVSTTGALMLALAAPSAARAQEAVAASTANVPADDTEKLAELLGQENAGATAEPSLKFYGFADFNVFKYVGLSDKWKDVLSQPLSFSVGKVNVYMEGNIAPDWKSLIEVRYLFLPNGAALPDSYLDPIANPGRYNAVAGDFTDHGRPVTWSGIRIERAYLEHTFNNYLTVRAGRFLTPWGIWNVDHGSPVIIGPAKPYVIGEAFFPEAQTGFDAFGSIPVGESTLGYHLTLSNGRGPTEVFQDLDDNKAIGGRLSLKMYRLGQIEVGVSGYGGTVTDQRQKINLAKLLPEFFQYEHYRELSWAVDFRWLWKNLHLQAEAALQDKVWDDGARPVVGTGVQPDMRRFGMYSLLGYRLPWLNLMPYVMYSYYDAGTRQAFGLARKVNVLTAGLNVRVLPSVVFKIEYERGIFSDVAPGSFFEDPIGEMASQLAWAF